jgi:tRNA pseudouridine38-40 synthase
VTGAGVAGPPVRRTLRIDLTWDGTGFAGWQRQASARTVQGELEAALDRVLGAGHKVVGAGRTDAGVHAERAVASVRTTSALAATRIERALDAVLPRDVGVLAVREAPEGFHALRDACWKWYRYALLEAPTRRPLGERRAWRLARLPPLERLEEAAAPLLGRHDFAAFANAGSPREDTWRTLEVVRWRRTAHGATIDVVGDGFLYKMVRTLVGTMLRAAADAGAGAEMRRVLAARERRAAAAPAPAHGLTLMDVGYGARRIPARAGGGAGGRRAPTGRGPGARGPGALFAPADDPRAAFPPEVRGG